MDSQFPQPLLDRIHRGGIVAVLVVDEVPQAVPLARALLAGGIDVMELTLRTPVAVDCLKAIRQEVPEMLAGMGTVLTSEQVDSVVAAGASFAVAPGTNPRVIDAAQQAGLPFAPGIATPSDLEVAAERGCREVKFFPAEASGGRAYLRSIAAPYRHLGIRFLPLGGINAKNVAGYLSEPHVLAVGGSWIAPRAQITGGDWEAITTQARQARQIADQARQETTS